VNRAGRISILTLIVVATVVGALFTLQNLDRTSDLSLDLWVVAYHLSEPQPVPYLLWGAFAAGLLLGGGWSILGRLSAQARVRGLEQQVARSNLQTTDDDWT